MKPRSSYSKTAFILLFSVFLVAAVTKAKSSLPDITLEQAKEINADNTVIFLFRHGERCDRSDMPCYSDKSGITITGTEKAQQEGIKFATIFSEYDIYSSNAVRTIQTAKFFSGKEPVVMDSLSDCNNDLYKTLESIARESHKRNIVIMTHNHCLSFLARDRLGKKFKPAYLDALIMHYDGYPDEGRELFQGQAPVRSIHKSSSHPSWIDSARSVKDYAHAIYLATLAFISGNARIIMNRIIPAGCLAALFLAGCNSPSQHTPVPRNYGAASDVAVTRHTQYTLWDKGVFSGQLPVSTGSHLLTANSDRLSFDWEGDAIELLNELARVRGMQFNYNGVRLPLPVNLHVRDMTFSNTLRLIEAQTAWRATIHQYPGLLQVSFMQPENRKK
eukprot:gene12571-15357_t